jgi:hypothetical protein
MSAGKRLASIGLHSLLLAMCTCGLLPIRTEAAGRVVKRNAGETTEMALLPAGFPSQWARPQPAEEDFTGSSGVTCSAVGRGKNAGSLDSETNPRKNRIDEAHDAHILSVGTIEALPEDPKAPRDRTQWNGAQKAAIAGYEGVAVSATGFLATVDTSGHHARHEGSESCNCDLVGPDEVDWHMYLAPGPQASKGMSVVVEITPRVRRNHPGWTDAALKVASDSVRVTGWLMYDPQHPDQVGKSRATVWEIHPITKLEVWERGVWNNLDAQHLASRRLHT